MRTQRFRTRLRNGSTVTRIGNGMEGKRKGRESFRYVVGGWFVAKRSSIATAVERPRGDEKRMAAVAASSRGVR